VEITVRTVQGRYLMRPSPELNRILVGVLGRAQRLTGMKVHAVVVMSNHIHYLLSPRSAKQLARFMQYVQGNISRKVGKLRKWKGPFWSRRYELIAVSDEDGAQIARLRYLLAHGVKEDLVARARDWPGVHSAKALVRGRHLEGIWIDETTLGERRRRGENPSPDEVTSPETLVFSPLPCWRGLPDSECRALVQGLVEAIDRTALERRQATGIRVIGPRGVCRGRRRKRTKPLERSPAPRFHTVTREAWEVLRDAYLVFVSEFRAAAELLRKGVRDPEFPPGSFPPGLPFVPHEATG
jgi:hypothetical protein